MSLSCNTDASVFKLRYNIAMDCVACETYHWLHIIHIEIHIRETEDAESSEQSTQLHLK